MFVILLFLCYDSSILCVKGILQAGKKQVQIAISGQEGAVDWIHRHKFTYLFGTWLNLF